MNSNLVEAEYLTLYKEKSSIHIWMKWTINKSLQEIILLIEFKLFSELETHDGKWKRKQGRISY